MKIRPKVPVCTDCDHVFEYRGRTPVSSAAWWCSLEKPTARRRKSRAF